MSTHAGGSKLILDIPLLAQPTDTSCGPTCLQAVYGYFNDHVSVDQLIGEIPSVEGGGTYAVLLGVHALKRGYEATLYTYNLRIFDPTWFTVPDVDLAAKLHEVVKVKSGKRRQAARACLEFVESGGEVMFEELTGSLIRRFLKRGLPILTGLSATYLYRTPREISDTNEDDDIRGEPQGHFVILTGYHKEDQTVSIADPYELNPHSPERFYDVPMERLVNAILLGVLTYDANLLIIQPR